nr:MAG TPA: Protein of unknown function (DUF1492) [Caudoviricetes sp.]
MTAKEYLSQAWNIDRRINDKLAHVAQLRDMATNVSTVISDMPRSQSPNNQRMENIIARLTDTEEEINADIDHLVSLKLEIMNTIWQVEDENAQMLLERRYHSFKSWEDIAADMSVSIRWVHKIHAKALDDVEKILEKRQQSSS